MANTKKSRHLVVVESPAKARTISRYLGKEYEVAASIGHVRDLPPKELGVDVEAGFRPKYVTIRGKGKVIQGLKRKAKGVESVILATDPDREGEAIAYHVAEQLGLAEDGGRFRRVTFHEITRDAVRKAMESAGPIDRRKVEAQQARRVLDRLVGYQASPFLWKPIRPGLSAGRVQTVALRLVCEREDEIRAFEAREYWSITAHLKKGGHPFDAKLHQIDGKSFTLGKEEEAQAVLRDLEGVDFLVTGVKRRERRKNPFPPFTTSTLQQEAAKRLRFSAKRTMTVAQRLYEGVEVGGRGAVGLITYMRTDSTRVSRLAANAARGWVSSEFGGKYLPAAPRLYGGKQQKGAQEAHEAIRPTDVRIHPAEARKHLGAGAARLYQLVWLRFVASQMAPALYDTTTVDFDLKGRERGAAPEGRHYLFRATGSIVKFDGFTRLYLAAKEGEDPRRLDDLEPLPAIGKGERGELEELEAKQHFTQPPPRFSEASLVRELERLGIGRPSTYAQIISKIQDRQYAEQESRRFKPTGLGEVVAKLLVRVFPDIFDVAFTSRMEGELDRVEDGETGWRDLLEGFYPAFRRRLEAGEARRDAIIKEILATESETCTECGRPMLVRFNRYGRFLGCSGYPGCKSTRPIESGSRVDERLGRDPETGLEVFVRDGPFGPYVQLGEGGKGKKPKRVSFPGKGPLDAVGLDYALKLLALPRSLGVDPGSGEEVVAGTGRYGPYVRRGKSYVSLDDPDELFTIGVEEAARRIRDREKGRRQPLRTLGPDPESGAELQILDGRFGPYVTDGKVNASLRKGMTPEEVTLEEAADLLRARRARMGRGKAKKGKRGSKAGATSRGRGRKKPGSGG